MSVMFYPSIFCVSLLMDLFVLCVTCLTVFGNCVVKQFAICCCFVVEVMEVLCWIDRVWSSKQCVCCACDPSVHLDVLSIGFVFVCVCRK